MWKVPLVFAFISLLIGLQKPLALMVWRSRANEQNLNPLGPVEVVDVQVVDLLLRALIGSLGAFMMVFVLVAVWRGVKVLVNTARGHGRSKPV